MTVIVQEIDAPPDTNAYAGRVTYASEDWGGQVVLSYTSPNPDSVTVLIQIEDTGIYEQHFFVWRDGQWNLEMIKDSST